MIITKMALPRRTFLRGVGAAVSLPLLDAMLPALSAMANTPATSVQRFGFFYLPNGVSMNQTGIDYWKPKTAGPNFDFTPILKPLEPFKDQLAIVTGLHHRSAESLGDGTGDHTRGTGTWLTGTRLKRTEGSDLRAGVSADQVIATRLGKDTGLPSLELAILPNSVTVGCDMGYSCAYGQTVSWSSPTTPLPTESSPRLVFEQLCGDGGSASMQRAALHRKNSILDSTTDELARLQAKLGPTDRATVSDYVDVVREVERRIQSAEKNNALCPLPECERPGIGVPERFDDHVKLMFDLQCLGFQGDVTRVSSFMFGKELSARMYPEIGLPEPHHSMSHHGSNPANMEKYAKLCAWETELFAYLLDRMRSIPDGDGNLLDHSLLLLGASLSNADIHSHIDMPTALVGGVGNWKKNRHVATKMGTPFSNLLLAIVNEAGVSAESFGDSVGGPLDLDSIRDIVADA